MQLSAAEWVWRQMTRDEVLSTEWLWGEEDQPAPVLHPNWDARLEQLDRIDEEGCGATIAAMRFGPGQPPCWLHEIIAAGDRLRRAVSAHEQAFAGGHPSSDYVRAINAEIGAARLEVQRLTGTYLPGTSNERAMAVAMDYTA